MSSPGRGDNAGNCHNSGISSRRSTMVPTDGAATQLNPLAGANTLNKPNGFGTLDKTQLKQIEEILQEMEQHMDHRLQQMEHKAQADREAATTGSRAASTADSGTAGAITTHGGYPPAARAGKRQGRDKANRTRPHARRARHYTCYCASSGRQPGKDNTRRKTCKRLSSRN